MATTKDRAYIHSSELTKRERAIIARADAQAAEARRNLRRAVKAKTKTATQVHNRARDYKTQDALNGEGVEPNPGPQQRKLCHVCRSPDHLAKQCPSGRATPADANGISCVGKPAEVVERVREQEFSTQVEALLIAFDHAIDRPLARVLVREGAYDAATAYLKGKEITPSLVTDLLGDLGHVWPEPESIPAPPVVHRPLQGIHYGADAFEKNFRARGILSLKARVLCYLLMGACFALAFLCDLSFFNAYLEARVERAFSVGGPNDRGRPMFYTYSGVPSYSFPWDDFTFPWYLVLAGLFTAAGLYLAWRLEFFHLLPMAVTVEEIDVSDPSDVRIVTNTHVPRLPNPIRYHRYTFTDWSRPFRQRVVWHVCDHWATVALSEYGGGDVDSFLSNCHAKFLRCAALNVSDAHYETLKIGTREFLRLYLTSPGFLPPVVPSWGGARLI